MKIKYSKDAVKFLEKQSKKTVIRIREAIMGLTKKPPEGDITLMKGFSDGKKRLREGPWRIIYKVESKNIYIIDIGSRGDIYK